MAAAHGAVTRRVSKSTVRRPQPVAAPVWSTPALLRLGLYSACLAALLMMIAVLAGAFTSRDALRTIGREAAPGVLAAEHIRGTLADMDRSAVTELLSKTADPVVFEARRKEAADAIIRATEDISYRDLERVPLQELGLGLGSYTAQIQQARDEFKAGDKRYLEAYRKAAATMDDDLQPAAEQLRTSMGDILERSYLREGKLLKISLLSVIGAALLTGSILASLQFFLAARMRRVVNPLLFVATLATIVFAGYAADALQREVHDLGVAKEIVFASENERIEANALQKIASLDASRNKLDPAHFGLKPDRPGASLVTIDHDPETIPTRRHFDLAVEQGFQDVSGFEFSAPSATLLIMLLTFLGILPRLPEYSL